MKLLYIAFILHQTTEGNSKALPLAKRGNNGMDSSGGTKKKAVAKVG